MAMVNDVPKTGDYPALSAEVPQEKQAHIL